MFEVVKKNIAMKYVTLALINLQTHLEVTVVNSLSLIHEKITVTYEVTELSKGILKARH